MVPETAAEAIAAGEIDGVGFARPFLADQAWVTKLMEGRPRISALHSVPQRLLQFVPLQGRAQRSGSFRTLCIWPRAVNAETMQWDKHYIKETKNPQTVHIIGGGIGGMEAARVLALRGHKPIIYEKSDKLGGTFIAASAESYKGKLRDLLAWYIRQMEQLHVEVHFGEEVSDLSALEGQQVIVATGSTPRVLRGVPGHEKMIEACEYLIGTPVGQKVAVIGGRPDWLGDCL